jgi:hypothetical protein
MSEKGASLYNEIILDCLEDRLMCDEPMKRRPKSYRGHLKTCPTSTLYSQEFGGVYLRRFSPNNGRLLAGFGRTGSPTLFIYRVSYHAKPASFRDFFALAHTISFGLSTENVCKDFMLFTSDERYVSYNLIYWSYV